MTMMQHDFLKTDLANARLVLVEMGRLERQLTSWMAEMIEIDANIFERLQTAWVERYRTDISHHYGITQQPLLDNISKNHMPLEACMMTDLLNIGPLPVPPEWFRRYASQEVSHTLGFATSKLYATSSRLSATAPLYAPKSGMLEYLRSFKSSRTSLPDEKWFEQALKDYDDTFRDFPSLYWLAREIALRENPETPLDLMDGRLEFWQVPDKPRPSQKILARFLAKLAEPKGQRELDFARCFLHEHRQFSLLHRTYFGLLGTLPLYRAAILPRFVALLNLMLTKAGSPSKAAEIILHTPQPYSFRYGRPQDSGIMRLGKIGPLRTKFPSTPKHVKKSSPYGCTLTKSEVSEHIATGCLWMIAAARQPSDLDWLLEHSASALQNESVADFNRLVSTIGEIGTAEGVRGLVRLRSKLRHATMLSHLNATLALTAAAMGLTTVEAEELVAQDYGLDTHHRRKEALTDDFAVVLSITGSGQAVIHYEDRNGTVSNKLPASVRNATGCETLLRNARSDAKQLSADMSTHRQRLEGSWLTGQTWSWKAFEERWLCHPVLGWLARRMIWMVAEPDGTIKTCLIRDDGTLCGPDGKEIPSLPPEALLSLWHPLHSKDQKTITQWRATLEQLKVTQPIRQAWRETYTITQAEQESSPASYRYARRILSQAQVVEVGRQKQWRIRTLTGHLPSSESAPWSLRIPAHGIYADLRTGGVGEHFTPDGSLVFSYVMTDRIRFCVLQDEGDWQYDGGRKLKETTTPVRLGSVDPIVFSEVMRDVDLMVSVAARNIAFDPDTLFSIPDLAEWRRHDGLGDIQCSAEPHFGNLAQSRREIIESLLPELGAGDAVTLEKRHVLVKGKRYHYRIHLGSGDVMVIPQQRQIVIPDKKTTAAQNKLSDYQPLHDDERLNSILQKITMLLRDDRIRDQTILDQLNALDCSGT